jgi:hypothetical protein
MTGTADPYREWDAAYLLGALSPAERREYEQHLAGCAECSAEISSMAGMPGILSVVPNDRAMELATPAIGETPDLMPGLVVATDRVRRRARLRVAALVATAAAVVGIAVWEVPRIADEDAPVEPGISVTLTRTVARPLSANARLIAEPWGTKIEATCRYDAVPPSPGQRPPRSVEYAMYVTDRAGTSVQVATWLASPGAEAEPYATTTVPLDQIAAIDIRSVRTGTVLLQARL